MRLDTCVGMRLERLAGQSSPWPTSLERLAGQSSPWPTILERLAGQSSPWPTSLERLAGQSSPWPTRLEPSQPDGHVLRAGTPCTSRSRHAVADADGGLVQQLAKK